jgi:hypothetical protein
MWLYYKPDISEERFASIFMVKEITDAINYRYTFPRSLFSSTLKMETTRSSETSVYYKPVRRHIPEDGIVDVYCFHHGSKGASTSVSVVISSDVLPEFIRQWVISGNTKIFSLPQCCLRKMAVRRVDGRPHWLAAAQNISPSVFTLEAATLGWSLYGGR